MTIAEKYWFVGAFLVYFIAAWFSVGHYHDDEYYQILDFAAYKLGFQMQNSLMWEHESAVRSGLQPFIAFIVAKLSMFANVTSPFIWAFYLRLLTLIVSFLALFAFFKVIKEENSVDRYFPWVLFFLLFSWIQIFVNIRFSSEGWSSSLFLLSYAIYFSNQSSYVKKYFFVGLFLGLAFLFRFQTGFLILGLGLWIIFHRKETIREYIILSLGFMCAILLGLIVDYWFYEKFTISFLNYFSWHIIDGSIDHIVEPWWFYIYYSMVQLVPPITFLVPFTILIFWFLFPRHPITWITIPFILFHHYFGHKEMRYLFPILPFIPIIFSMAIIKLINYFEFLKKNMFENFLKFLLCISFLLNIPLVFLTMSLPASKEVALWQNCFSEHMPDNSILLVYDPDNSGSSTGELELDFYNQRNIPILSVKDETEISKKLIEFPDRKLFYASRKKGRASMLVINEIKSELVCQALPDWLLKININNWTSRASIWQIWGIK